MPAELKEINRKINTDEFIDAPLCQDKKLSNTRCDNENVSSLLIRNGSEKAKKKRYLQQCVQSVIKTQKKAKKFYFTHLTVLNIQQITS